MWKALHPHALERQNVKLALKVFSNTTAAALNYYGPHNENLENWNGTASFINFVWKWWCVVNVKHPLKGRNTRNIYAHPIDTVNHENLQFLSSLATWLDCWSNKNKTLNESLNEQNFNLFYSLNILKIEDLCKFEIAKFIFKLKNIPDFNYMHNLKPINQIHKYNTRLSKNNYFLQRKKTETGKKSLEYIGSTIWLDLPSEIKLYSFPKFKQQLKFYLLSNYIST